MSESLLQLTRPLAVFDLETTGIDTATARIVQFGMVRFNTAGVIEQKEELLINPGIAIPEETTAIHGITDEMVKDQPTFSQIASQIFELFADCDLAGFNMEKFDLPILVREFEDAGLVGFAEDRKIIDAMTIFHRNEKRDLAGAVLFYLDKDHSNAHRALADAQATAEILLAQLKRYDLPRDNAGLHDYCHEKDPRFVDQDGKFVWIAGEAAISFGKHKNTLLRQLVEQQRDYLQWMVGKGDFSPEVQDIVRAALEGEFPRKEENFKTEEL